MCASQSGVGKRSEHTGSMASPRPRRVGEVGVALGAVNGFYQAVLFPAEFSGTEPLDNPHGSLTMGAERDRGRRRLDHRRKSRWNGQQAAAKRKECSAPAVSKQAEVTDAWKSTRQNVLEEASEELLMSECHDAALAVVRIVFPAEGHLRIRYLDQAMVRDRDAVRIAGQIMEHMFRSPKGFLAYTTQSWRNSVRRKAANGFGSANDRQAPKKTSLSWRNARRRPATNFPRNTRLSTRTGRKK